MANLLTLKILNKLKLLDRFNLTSKRKFVIPVYRKIGYNNLFQAEPWLSRLLRIVYDIKLGVFIDVGANIGQTLLKIKKIDITSDYFGFEPNPICNNYLQSLVMTNNFPNVQLFPVGLSNENKLIKLYASSETDSEATVLSDFRIDMRTNFIYNIPVVTGDEVVSNVRPNKISLIKIDVEGYELEVLEGFRETIKAYSPIVICEILPVYTLSESFGQERKRRQDKIAALLKDIGYCIFEISENSARLNEIDGFGVHGDMSRTNYLFCHESDKAKVLSPKDHRY